MTRFLKKRDLTKGQVPGTPVFIGRKKLDKVKIKIMDYDDFHLEEKEIGEIEAALPYAKEKTVTWINIYGLHDTDFITSVGKVFNLHPLILEGIVNTGQRPKTEEYDNCLFFVLQMLVFDEEEERVKSEQFAMIITDKFLLTFQEQPGEFFEPVRERIRHHRGRIRQSGIDYLAYALLDTVVDNYIYLIEQLGERIEALEEHVLRQPEGEVLRKIYHYKREINFVRRVIRPVREAISKFIKNESEMVSDHVFVYLKDLEDLLIYANEAIETYREILSDDLNIYHTSVGNRLNEIMRILTVISVIFIPLTFIAGVYGTNFQYLPEIQFRYAYPVFWLVMLVVALVMIAFFRKKHWM
jgi:magnesium transporter